MTDTILLCYYHSKYDQVKTRLCKRFPSFLQMNQGLTQQQIISDTLLKRNNMNQNQLNLILQFLGSKELNPKLDILERFLGISQNGNTTSCSVTLLVQPFIMWMREQKNETIENIDEKDSNDDIFQLVHLLSDYFHNLVIDSVLSKTIKTKSKHEEVLITIPGHTTLLPHQAKTVRWMQSIEKQISKKKPVGILSQFHYIWKILPGINLYMQILPHNVQKISLQRPPVEQLYRSDVYTNGGVLEQSSNNDNYVCFLAMCYHFYESISSTNDLPSEQLLPKTIADLSDNTSWWYFNTTATLIITTSIACSKWLNLANGFFDKQYIVIVNTITDYKKLQWHMIYKARIIILNIDILYHNQYKLACTKPMVNDLDDFFSDLYEDISSNTRPLKKTRHSISSTTNNNNNYNKKTSINVAQKIQLFDIHNVKIKFHNIIFNRVVLDEAHQLINETIPKIQSKYNWILGANSYEKIIENYWNKLSYSNFIKMRFENNSSYEAMSSYIKLFFCKYIYYFSNRTNSSLLSETKTTFEEHLVLFDVQKHYEFHSYLNHKLKIGRYSIYSFTNYHKKLQNKLETFFFTTTNITQCFIGVLIRLCLYQYIVLTELVNNKDSVTVFIIDLDYNCRVLDFTNLDAFRLYSNELNEHNTILLFYFNSQNQSPRVLILNRAISIGSLFETTKKFPDCWWTDVDLIKPNELSYLDIFELLNHYNIVDLLTMFYYLNGLSEMCSEEFFKHNFNLRIHRQMLSFINNPASTLIGGNEQDDQFVRNQFQTIAKIVKLENLKLNNALSSLCRNNYWIRCHLVKQLLKENESSHHRFLIFTWSPNTVRILCEQISFHFKVSVFDNSMSNKRNALNQFNNGKSDILIVDFHQFLDTTNNAVQFLNVTHVLFIEYVPPNENENDVCFTKTVLDRALQTVKNSNQNQTIKLFYYIARRTIEEVEFCQLRKKFSIQS